MSKISKADEAALVAAARYMILILNKGSPEPWWLSWIIVHVFVFPA